MKNVLSVILGGGRGTRLYPLTKYRAKPAVPLAGKYRLIDIPVSNCLNSGLNKIFVLTQFNSVSLNRHIFRAYKMDYFSGGFVEIMAADQSMDHGDWFQGSADAVRKCLRHLTSDPRIQYILILSGDQLYRMNFQELIKSHIEKDSQITIACNVVDADEIKEFGIIGIDRSEHIKHFVEKPKNKEDVKDMAVDVDGKRKYLASMGIYLFNKDTLVAMLANNNKADFGKEVIPDAIGKAKMSAFLHKGYWKDIGSIDSFYRENLSFINPKPPLDLYDDSWPFFTRPRYLPLSKFTNSSIENSAIAEGVIMDGAKVTNSIIGLRSRVGSGSLIEDAILMGNDYYDRRATLGIGKCCSIKKTIIDKNVQIGDNVQLANRKKLVDYEDEFCVIRSGIIIIPKGTIIPSDFVI